MTRDSGKMTDQEKSSLMANTGAQIVGVSTGSQSQSVLTGAATHGGKHPSVEDIHHQALSDFVHEHSGTCSFTE